MPEVVRLHAPAKVNLRLRVLQREASGYHSLESLFCAISLSDGVEVRRGAPGIRLEVRGGIETGPVERNLSFRAAESFYSRTGRVPAVDLVLEKRIPSQAGLGGGSSDAAATLRALNALEGGPLDSDALLQLGITLGADVPFFLCGAALALGWSRGERLLTLPALPARPVLVAHPGAGVSTGEIFGALAALRRADDPPVASRLNSSQLSSWEGVAGLHGNDFQPVVTARLAVLGPALAAMQRAGAVINLLAGSGGCVFGIFDSEAARDDAHAQVDAMGLDTWRCETLESLPDPRVDPPRAVA